MDSLANKGLTMRWKLIILLPLMALAGCTRFEGPLEVRKKDRADSPGYSIPEQRQRARERNTFIEDDRRILPGAEVDRPSPTGR